MKKRLWVFFGTVIVVLLVLLAALQFRASPVTDIKISPDSVSLVPGVSMQLNVRGYTKDGDIATSEQCQELSLIWGYKADDNAFTVNEDGVLTAISPGIGNVWVQSGDGKLNSRPITVSVK